jgi:hypothetical protein
MIMVRQSTSPSCGWGGLPQPRSIQRSVAASLICSVFPCSARLMTLSASSTSFARNRSRNQLHLSPTAPRRSLTLHRNPTWSLSRLGRLFGKRVIHSFVAEPHASGDPGGVGNDLYIGRCRRYLTKQAAPKLPAPGSLAGSPRGRCETRADPWKNKSSPLAGRCPCRRRPACPAAAVDWRR